MRLPVLIVVAALGLSSAARADVIEIGDDGAVRTYDRPTRFVAAGEEDAPVVSAKRSLIAPQGDAFVRAAAAHGVDVDLLRAVAWTESRGRGDAVSAKGALGVMQLMPATAAALGVDPRDPTSNIAGGAAYLSSQIARFGSVPLALAAYNAGPGAVLRYGGIPPYRETQGYVASVLARWRPGAPVAPARFNLSQSRNSSPLPEVTMGDGLLIEVSPS